MPTAVAPVALPPSHSNGTHFGTLSAGSAAPTRALAAVSGAMPTLLPARAAQGQAAQSQASKGAAAAAVVQLLGDQVDERAGNTALEQAAQQAADHGEDYTDESVGLADERRLNEHHHARALRWARRFVTRD